MIDDETVKEMSDATADVLIKLGSQEYSKDDYTEIAERTFRQAWQPQGPVIAVNMEKAKEIWRHKIRIQRDKLWQDLDSQFMKALETNADTTAIVAKKQNLRDAPNHPDIDAATTPEQLKAVQPLEGITIE